MESSEGLNKYGSHTIIRKIRSEHPNWERDSAQSAAATVSSQDEVSHVGSQDVVTSWNGPSLFHSGRDQARLRSWPGSCCSGQFRRMWAIFAVNKTRREHGGFLCSIAGSGEKRNRTVDPSFEVRSKPSA